MLRRASGCVADREACGSRQGTRRRCRLAAGAYRPCCAQAALSEAARAGVASDAIDDARSLSAGQATRRCQGGTGEARRARLPGQLGLLVALSARDAGIDRDLSTPPPPSTRSAQPAAEGRGRLDEAIAPPAAELDLEALERALLSATTAGIGNDDRARTGPIRAGAPAALERAVSSVSCGDSDGDHRAVRVDDDGEGGEWGVAADALDAARARVAEVTARVRARTPLVDSSAST